tara:strand:- start:318 stop:650 length:333 start_codon:yes stop_codon:yes gene_type:complete
VPRSHCGLFGRCIAGQGCSGNIHYFYAVIVMGWLGFVTTVAAVLMSGWGLLDAYPNPNPNPNPNLNPNPNSDPDPDPKPTLTLTLTLTLTRLLDASGATIFHKFQGNELA